MTVPYSLKGCYPFRLGTTSYIIPDDILPNIRYLADRVDDVQLILFESDSVSNLPSPDVVRELALIGEDKDLSYTVHFPLDVFLGARDEGVRQASLDMCRRVIECCRPLNPQTFALHFAGDDPDDRGMQPSLDMPAWLAAHHASLGSLIAEVQSPRNICVETLAYPYALIEDVVISQDAGVCIDIGHLLRWGHDVETHLERYADRLHLMHIHGVRDGKDHRSLRDLDPKILKLAQDIMSPQDDSYRVMTVEVFGQDYFDKSMACLREQRAL